MGIIKASIQLSNPLKPHLAANEVVSIVDTGSLNLCLPQYLATRLGLKELERREVIMPDGRRIQCPYVGPILVQFESRKCYTGGLVIGDDVLLGSIPLEDMDLLLHPASESIALNPDSPELPTVFAENMRE